MLNDPIANALSNILNYEKIGKSECKVTPVSKVLKKLFEIFNKLGYLGKTEEVTKERGGVLKVHLLGKINKCGVIKPRFSFKLDELEKFEKRFLPAKGMGVLIVTTPKGIMTHLEAKKQKLGGKLLAYCY